MGEGTGGCGAPCSAVSHRGKRRSLKSWSAGRLRNTAERGEPVRPPEAGTVLL